MHKIKAKARAKHSSRRAPPLQDSDYDHEINLVDNSAPVPVRTTSPESNELSPKTSVPPAASGPSGAPSNHSNDRGARKPTVGHNVEAGASEGPAVAIEEPTPLEPTASSVDVQQADSGTLQKKEQDTAIDILYENERGGFLCGVGLFSSKALGNLDPPAWTNVAHKPSATDIHTAQVPDPSWEWAWPEWRVNHGDDVDAGGWEYSFMFSHRFSWHGPAWWNSFVRRRAWIRRRVRKDPAHISNDPHLLNPEYFTIRASSDATRDSRRSSRVGSQLGSKPSKTTMSEAMSANGDGDAELIIDDMETLLQVLRASSIDREKIEAVDNYLEHDRDDAARLQEEMHEIMSLFIFQASRRMLLSRLAEAHRLAQQERKEQDTDQLRTREANLDAAIKHADEELRQLEYWSDVKGAVEAGDSRSAVDEQQGWEEEWRGVDQSGPSAPAQPQAKEDRTDQKDEA